MATRRYSDGYRKLQDVDTPRRIAFDVLMAVETEDAFANIAQRRRCVTRVHMSAWTHATLHLPPNLSMEACEPRDVSTGVLGRYLTRPIDKVDTPVRVLLRMGAHQLLNMRVGPIMRQLLPPLISLATT